jgi:hypothetical protein
MIGPSPEDSLAAPYLSMTRREDLADQINSSMLRQCFALHMRVLILICMCATDYVGESPAPALQIWAQTTKVVWDQVISTRATLPRAADVPADVKAYVNYVVRSPEGEEDQVCAWYCCDEPSSDRNMQAQTQTAMPFDLPTLAQA